MSEKNRSAAERAIRTIRSGVAELEKHPETGRPMEGMEPIFREKIVRFGRGAYVVLYALDGDRIVILAVRHGREAGY